MRFRQPFPILYVSDVDRASRFYRDVLGFRVSYRWPPEGPLEYVFLEEEPIGIGLCDRAVAERIQGRPLAPEGPRFELCLLVDDVEGAREHLASRGARMIVPPTERPWGERTVWFEDPEGNPIHIRAKIG